MQQHTNINTSMNPFVDTSPPQPRRPPPLHFPSPSAAEAPPNRRRRNPDPAAAAAVVAVAIRPCSECGRRFPSWKALFGHMRCHPERQWRGINPPPHFRRREPAAADADAFEFTEEEREVAASLVMLAERRPVPPRRTRRRKKEKDSAVGCYDHCSKEHESYVIDLNMPPPQHIESGERVSATTLDLRLGI